ncbi:MAG: hypothetical protein HW414_82 [Dehalococcoidia bacterium]|nr:hypothetical protein [Dehalococcoidia bacterium]
MHEFVGFERNAEGLRTALERLNGLREKSRDAGALRRASTQATPWDTTSYRAADKKQKSDFILMTASGDKDAALGPPSDW